MCHFKPYESIISTYWSEEEHAAEKDSYRIHTYKPPIKPSYMFLDCVGNWSTNRELAQENHTESLSKENGKKKD